MIITGEQMPKKATLTDLTGALSQMLGKLDYEEALEIANDRDSAKHVELKDLLGDIEFLFRLETLPKD